MKFFTGAVVLFAFIAKSFALPATHNLVDVLLGVLRLNGLIGNDTPLFPTTIHSPQCANTNNGTFVCCQSTFDGALPIVVDLSAAVQYPLTKNTISGFTNCKQSFTSCNTGTELCCGVVALMPVVALYCQHSH